jgi:carboxypeptidase C (cathepsin A)
MRFIPRGADGAAAALNHSRFRAAVSASAVECGAPGPGGFDPRERCEFRRAGALLELVGMRRNEVKRGLMVLVLACLMGTLPAYAAEKPKPAPEKEKKAESSETADAAKPEQSVTQHSVVIGGATINYTATAGTLIIRNEKDEPWASMDYIAYTKRDVADESRRPITFAYNGGPGSSSVWLHMGALGPRRVVTTDAGETPPAPYKIVDNADSIIDKTDLVMIDPVGTGISKAVGKAKDKDFWGADPDIESVSQFIKQYVSDNNRWNSPKYLLGESYGTTRSAGVVDYLQTRENMQFNGVILVSVALDLEAIFNLPGNDRPYPFFLPTYAAVAFYHHMLPNPPKELAPFLDEVRKYALGEYTGALMKGDELEPAERAAVIKKLHEYTGLSEAYIDKANIRIDEGEFTQELLREHGETVGRLDARFTGPSLDILAEEAEYDPQSAAISAAFTAAFLDYCHKDLKFGQGKTYHITNPNVFRTWDFKHKVQGAPFPLPTLTNTGIDLAHALKYNPDLRILVLNGYFDLATPFLATEYMMSHLGLDKTLASHIEMKYFPAGHMMYVHEPSLKKMKADVAAFIDRTDRL